MVEAGTGVLQFLLLMFLYASIWFVPIGINQHRRSKRQRPYWSLLAISLALELTTVYIGLLAAKQLAFELAGIYLAPVVAAIIAGLFYITVAKQADNRRR